MREAAVNLKEKRAVYVPIDVSKYYHKVMLCAPGGRIIRNPFEIDVYSESLDKLLAEVKRVKEAERAKTVIFALEPTSYYHYNLYKRLKALNQTVLLINPSITATIRNLNYRRVKTDDIDLKVLAQAIEEQKGIIAEGRDGQYAELRILTRSRWRKTYIAKRIKTSIHEYVDKLWPGLCNRVDSSQGLVRNLWESTLAWAILQLCPDPKVVSQMTPLELQSLIKGNGFKGICGPKHSVRVIEHAKKAAGMAIHHPHLVSCLQQDLQELNHLNEDMQKLELQIVEYQSVFPELLHLLSLGSISPVLGLTFIAEAGDIRRFSSAKQLVHYAGLSVSYQQSGQYVSQQNHMIKEGNKYLRHTTMMIARNLARCNPEFRERHQELVAKKKRYYTAIGAIANKFIHVAYHLMTNKENYDVKY